VRYQQRQMLKDTRPRGRPIGAYSSLGAIEDEDGNYDGTYSSVSREDLVRDAKALGVSSKGDKEAIARRIVNKKTEKEEAEELIGGLEDLANMPHTSTKAAAASAPETNIEDMLDAALPRRKTKAYKAETVEDMIEELTHRGVEIPEKEKDKEGKEITTGYKQILYDLMKNSD